MTINEQLKAVREERANLEQAVGQLNAARARLRVENLAEDAAIREKHVADYEAARAKRDNTAQAISELTEKADALKARQRNGDRTVTATDVRAVADEIETFTNYLVFDDVESKKAERRLRPYLAGNELALLAADVLDSITDVPVLIYTDPSMAPEIEPAVILSQTTVSEGYGVSPEVSGTVLVTLKGEPTIDWRRVQIAFDREGCDGRFNEHELAFTKAMWPLPVLAAPSEDEVRRFGELICDAWRSDLTQDSVKGQLERAGYTFGSFSFADELVPLTQVASSQLEVADGFATGEVQIVLGVARSGAGLHLNGDNLAHDLRQLLPLLSEVVGGQTEAGEITGYELIDVTTIEGSHWDVPATYGQSGRPLWPATIAATIRVTYAYQPLVA